MITLRRLARGSAARSADGGSANRLTDRGQGGSAPEANPIWTIHFEVAPYLASTFDTFLITLTDSANPNYVTTIWSY